MASETPRPPIWRNPDLTGFSLMTVSLILGGTRRLIWSCQKRNQTEAMVKVLKAAFQFALPVSTLDHWPWQQEDDLAPLIPNVLLLGHNTAEKPSMEYDDSVRSSALENF